MLNKLSSLAGAWQRHEDHHNCHMLAACIHPLLLRCTSPSASAAQASAPALLAFMAGLARATRCPFSAALPFGPPRTLACLLLRVLQWGCQSRALAAPAAATACVLLRMLRLQRGRLADAVECELVQAACAVGEMQRAAAEEGWQGGAHL